MTVVCSFTTEKKKMYMPAEAAVAVALRFYPHMCCRNLEVENGNECFLHLQVLF